MLFRSSNRYIELVLSGEQGTRMQAVLYASKRGSGRNIIEQWDEYTKSSNVNRRVRYIYTGNLLQAFDKASSGKLISYTCKNGETKKGILMPEHWQPNEAGKSTTRSVPLKFCRRAIQGLSRGSVLITDADVSFILQWDGMFRIITKSLSMQKFDWLIKNKELLPLIRENGGFQKTGSTWAGTVEAKNLEKAIDIIYMTSGCNAQLSAAQVDMIQQDIVRTEVKPKERIELPKNVHVVKPETSDNDKTKRLRLAKVKAKAKLKILTLMRL